MILSAIPFYRRHHNLLGEGVVAPLPGPIVKVGGNTAGGGKGKATSTSSVGVYTFDSGVPSLFAQASANSWTVVSDADATGGTSMALRSPDIGAHGGTGFLLENVTGSSCTIRYKVSSESGFDFFRVWLNGTTTPNYPAKDAGGGSVAVQDSGAAGGWESVTFALAGGANRLSFIYTKDGSGDGGTDDVRISKVTIT